MNKTRSAFCVVTILLFAPAALAQSAPGGTRIAVVNLARIFEEFDMVKDLEAKFDESRREVGAEADARRQAISIKRQELEAFPEDSSDYAARNKDLTRMEFEYKLWLATEEQTLKDRHKRWLEDIYTRTRKAVEQLAAERKIDLVITIDEGPLEAPDSITMRQEIMLRKVLFATPSVNLTDDLLERLNREYEQSGGISTLKW